MARNEQQEAIIRALMREEAVPDPMELRARPFLGMVQPPNVATAPGTPPPTVPEPRSAAPLETGAQDAMTEGLLQQLIGPMIATNAPQAGMASTVSVPPVASPVPQGFGAAQQGLPEDVAPGPPQTPEERDRRKAGWQTFLQRLQNEPFLQNVLFRMGTELMQPVAPTQTVAGAVGESLQSGVNFGLNQQELQRRALLEGQASEREERALTSDVEAQGARTEILRREEQRRAMSFPEQMRTLAQQIRLATSQADIAEIEKDFAKRMIESGLSKDEALTTYYENLGKAALAKAEGAGTDTLREISEQIALVNRVNQIADKRVELEIAKYGPEKAMTREEILAEMFTDPGSAGLMEEYAKAHAYFGLGVPGRTTSDDGAEETVIDATPLLEKRRQERLKNEREEIKKRAEEAPESPYGGAAPP